MRPGKPELLIVHNSLSRAPLLGNRRTGAAQSTKLGQVIAELPCDGAIATSVGENSSGFVVHFSAPYFVCCRKTWSRKVGEVLW